MPTLNYAFGSRLPIQNVFGGGKPNPKSQQLIDDAPKLFQSGLRIPDSNSFTPLFFRKLMSDSGALEAKNKRGAYMLIATPLDAERKEELESALFSNSVFSENPLIIRLDDFSAGVGLSTSSVVPVLDDRKQLLEQVEFRMKMVLSSAFSEDFQEFKSKKGLSEYESGILIMPVVGERFHDKDGLAVAPPFSINYFGRDAHGNALISVGAGLDGANNILMKSVCRMVDDHIDSSVLNHVAWAETINSMSLGSGGKRYRNNKMNSLNAFTRNLQPIEACARKLTEMINSFIFSAGQRYLEIAGVAIREDFWAVVQSSQRAIPEIKKPEIADSSIIVRTPLVCGTKVAYAEKVRFSRTEPGESEPGEEDKAFNRENKDYLLVIKVNLVEHFQYRWHLVHFSNASAIVLMVDEIRNPLFSHLGGIFRELDIPVLACSQNKVNFDVAEGNNKFMIYANEFRKEGFVAAI